MNVARWQEHRQEVARQAQASTIRVSGFSPDSKRATIPLVERLREIVSAKTLDLALLDGV